MRPALCSRFWQMWTCAFSASVVFGTIVTKGPGSPLASNAMKELEMACVLFTKAAVHSRRAAKALVSPLPSPSSLPHRLTKTFDCDFSLS